MTEFKLEIPYAIFNSDKVNENKQDEFKKLLIDNGFDSLNLDFDDAGNLELVICYAIVSGSGRAGTYQDEIKATTTLLKLLRNNDYLDLDLIKEHFKEDYLVYAYPIEVEAIYSAGLEQLEEE